MTPTSITKPIRLTTDTSIPEISSARKPPVKASGMVNITINGDFRDWNCATMMRYTSTTPSSSISSTCPIASMICSLSPLNSTVTPSGSASGATACCTADVTLVTL